MHSPSCPSWESAGNPEGDSVTIPAAVQMTIRSLNCEGSAWAASPARKGISRSAAKLRVINMIANNTIAIRRPPLAGAPNGPLQDVVLRLILIMRDHADSS